MTSCYGSHVAEPGRRVAEIERTKLSSVSSENTYGARRFTIASHCHSAMSTIWPPTKVRDLSSRHETHNKFSVEAGRLC